MNKFVKFYNSKKGDSVLHLWAPKDRKEIAWMWTPKEVNKLHDQYGTIKSIAYIGKAQAGSNAVSFRTIFSKLEDNGTTLVLSKDNYISEFMLVTSEPKPKAAKK